jgi:hypothetical protein
MKQVLQLKVDDPHLKGVKPTKKKYCLEKDLEETERPS